MNTIDCSPLVFKVAICLILCQGMKMTLNEALGQALKQVRNAKGYTQEDFSRVSSRTYMSTLERGIKSPTLDKLDEISREMGIHPLSILMIAYSNIEKRGNIDKLTEVLAVRKGDLNSRVGQVSRV